MNIGLIDVDNTRFPKVYITPRTAGSTFSSLEKVVYYLDYQCKHSFIERDCYASKEELLASL